MLSNPPHPTFGNPDWRDQNPPSYGFDAFSWGHDWLPLAVYNAVDPSIFSIVLRELKAPAYAEDFCREASRDFSGSGDSELDAIVAYHRSICGIWHRTESRTYHPTMFIVVDDSNWQQKGVLLVNLDHDNWVYEEIDREFDWLVDGNRVEFLRERVDAAVLSLVGMTAGLSSWGDKVENAEFGLQKDTYFALYSIADFDIVSTFWRGLFGSRKQRVGLMLARLSGGPASQVSLEEVPEVHRALVNSDPRYHPTLVVLVQERDFEHPLFVNLDFQGRVEALKMPIKAAADLFASIYLGERDWPASPTYDVDSHFASMTVTPSQDSSMES